MVRDRDSDPPVSQVDVRPLESHDFAAARTSERCQGHRCSQHRVSGLGGFDEHRQLLWGWHLHLDPIDPGCRGPGCGGFINPSPLDRLITCRRDDGVVFVHGGRGESFVQPPAVRGIQGVRPQLVEPDGPESWADPCLYLASILVDGPGSLASLSSFKPLVEKLAHGDAGPNKLAGLDF